MNILVTGTGGGIGQGIIKSLKLIKDMDIKVVAADISQLGAGLYAADVAYLVEKFDGNIVKTENWGLLYLSYQIKKNKKGNYIHLKIKGSGKTISELEKNEKIDKNLLRFLTVKVKKFDLKINYFEKKQEEVRVKSY